MAELSEDDVDRMHAANRRHWDHAASHWRDARDLDGIWRELPAHPELAFEGGAFDLITTSMPSLRGAKVCVVGSGDNYAAFALAACGAVVTSVDISQRQLDTAAERGAALQLDLDFVRGDAADLGGLSDAGFDLVVSTNGFFVWIGDLRRLFAGLWRILRAGGIYVFYDVHPFQRPFEREADGLRLLKPYRDSGPIADPDGTYEFHWTMGAILNALTDTGFALESVLESAPRHQRFWEDGHYDYQTGNQELADWKQNPLAGLPAWLTVAARRLEHPPVHREHEVG
jgi:SAM-dependent methyltransferase